MTKPDFARTPACLWWLVSHWSLLRGPLQLAAAVAMMAQREGLALLIGGIALLLETVQDRLTVGRRCAGCQKSCGGEVISDRIPPL